MREEEGGFPRLVLLAPLRALSAMYRDEGCLNKEGGAQEAGCGTGEIIDVNPPRSLRASAKHVLARVKWP